MALQKGEAVRRYSPALQPITVQRIERALDRVAEIIVARGNQGETWLPLYDHLERALNDYQAKEGRLAGVHQRVTRLRDQRATRSS
jgi:hypothetical protein